MAYPSATDFFRASIPPVIKALRQNRTVSSRTPKASAIWPLVQPDRVSKIARADIRTLLTLAVDIVVHMTRREGRYRIAEVYYDPAAKRMRPN